MERAVPDRGRGLGLAARSALEPIQVALDTIALLRSSFFVLLLHPAADGCEFIVIIFSSYHAMRKRRKKKMVDQLSSAQLSRVRVKEEGRHTHRCEQKLIVRLGTVLTSLLPFLPHHAFDRIARARARARESSFFCALVSDIYFLRSRLIFVSQGEILQGEMRTATG